MRPIDADKLPVTHGVFTPLGGNVYIEYNAVLWENIENAPTIEVQERETVREDVKAVKEEQKAVKPEMKNSCANSRLASCGCCHRRIAQSDNYCRLCGTKIDWHGILRE